VVTDDEVPGMARCAFLGLGVMGFPMAGHLAAAGHEVTVFNRTASKAERWTGIHAGRAASSPRAAADGAEFVLTCLGDDDDVRDVVYGDDGALAGLGAGAVLVDHTTASAALARELAAASAARGAGFVDAPVSGGQAGAENGAVDAESIVDTSYSVSDPDRAFRAFLNSETVKPVFDFWNEG